MPAVIIGRAREISARLQNQGDRVVVVCGLGILALTAILFTLSYPLLKYYDRPDLTFGKVGLPDGLPVMAVGWVLLFALYVLAYRFCPRSNSWRSLLPIALVMVGSSLLMIFTTPIASTDMYGYIARAHAVLDFHGNPFTQALTDFPRSQYLPFVKWAGVPDNYGPVWQTQSEAVARLVGHGLLLNLITFKFLVTAYYWAGLPIVFATMRLVYPKQALKATLLYGWNPLLQFEIAGNGHNDALLLFSILLAIWGLARGHHTVCLLAVGAGVLIKFVPLLILPGILIVIWRDPAQARVAKIRSVALALLIGMAAMVAMYLPFGLHSVQATAEGLVSRGNYLGQSPTALAIWTLVDYTSLPPRLSYFIVAAIAAILTVSVVISMNLRLWRLEFDDRAQLVRMAARAGYETFLVLLLLSLFFWPWYLSWIFAFAPLLWRPIYAARAILLTFGAPVIYVLDGFFVSHNAPGPQAFPTLIVVLIAFVPAGALTVASWIRRGLLERHSLNLSTRPLTRITLTDRA